MRFKEREEVKRSHSVMSDSCDPTDCSLPGSSVHGISQARVLEWVPFPSLDDLPDPVIDHLPNFRQTIFHLRYQGSIFRKEKRMLNL